MLTVDCKGGCHEKLTFLPLKALKDIMARPDKYPYYRMSAYEIYGSEGYQTLCDLFLKYYAERRPVCIAFAGRKMHRDDFLAIWLMGKEAYDPKTKQQPNAEPIGEILWCSDWPQTDDKEVRSK